MASPYMNLEIPVVGPLGTQGTEWAEMINECLDLIDMHDHSEDKGKQVTPAGININQDFEMNGNSLIEIETLSLEDLSSQPTDESCIYEFGGELCFNDALGNQVQLTSGGAINVSSLGTITGDYSTSSADLTYSDATKTFIFKQSASITANVDCGPVKIYRNVASSFYARLQISATQSANLDWTLPIAYPASTLPVKSSSAGVLSTSQIVTADIADLNVTEEKINSGAVTVTKLGNLAVQTAKIDNLAVTTGKIANGAVTKAKLDSFGQQISSSSGGVFSTASTSFVDVTNLSVTITGTGTSRLMRIYLIPENTGTGTVARVGGTSTLASDPIYLRLMRDGGEVSRWEISGSVVAQENPGAFETVEVIAAGTYTYKIQAAVGYVSSTAFVRNVKLVAEEC